MKKAFITLMLLCAHSIGFSQLGFGTPEIIKNWKRRTLLVVLYSNSKIIILQ